MPIFGCTVYEGAAVQVHQNVRAAGNFQPVGRFSDRHRQKCLFLDLCLGTDKNAYFLDLCLGTGKNAYFLDLCLGTGKNAYFWMHRL